jgi:hypothetical protein
MMTTLFILLLIGLVIAAGAWTVLMAQEVRQSIRQAATGKQRRSRRAAKREREDIESPWLTTACDSTTGTDA